LYAVELLGGNSRIPKLSETLTQRLDIGTLGRHLNGDEAFVSGATYYAAIKSGATVRPEMRVKDFAAFDIVAKFQTVDNETLTKLLFTNSRVRPTKSVALQRESDFTFDLEYSENATLPDGTPYVDTHTHTLSLSLPSMLLPILIVVTCY
jgi:molecular chaperone DnaK (HSP70)